MPSSPLAGKPAPPDVLIDVDRLIAAYYDRRPDPDNPRERVAFGTSGHRGAPEDGAFNEPHILAITQAICEHRARAGITGPLFLGADTHAASAPALRSALEVLAANGVETLVQAEGQHTPTPSLSRAIISFNAARGKGGAGLADGIVITPSHNPPRDGGFKYNPPNGGPADSDITDGVQARANQLLAEASAIRRLPYDKARVAPSIRIHDFLTPYVEDLPKVVDVDAIARARVKLGADPMGGASVQYWTRIAERFRLDLEVVNKTVDPRFAFMTLDHDGKIRMDCSSPYAMASLLALRERFAVAFGNDTDADRHGIVTPAAGLMNPNHYLAVAIEYLFTHREGWPARAAIGKTLVSSSLIDRVGRALGREVREVPVGFKWFVPGLVDGSLGFGGEESAGATFLCRDGSVLDHGQGRHPPRPARRRDHGGDGAGPRRPLRTAARQVRDVLLHARRRAGDAGREGRAGEAGAGGGHREHAGGRRDRREADQGARQRRLDRRPQGRERQRLVRRPSVRDRERLQDLRGEHGQSRAPGGDPERGARDRRARPHGLRPAPGSPRTTPVLGGAGR